MLAQKHSLAPAVALLAVPAPRASAAGVAGVHGNEWHADQLRLVSQEGAELSERPIAEPTSLRLPNCYSPPDTRQFLDGDPSLLCECLGNDLLRDTVIGVPLEARLPLRYLAKAATCRAAVPPLVGLAGPGASLPHLLNGLAAEGGAIVGGGNLNDAQVHADEVLHFQRRGLGQVHGGEQVELALAPHKVALALDAVEALGLILAIDEANDLPAGECGEAYPIQPLEAQVALVVGDCPIGAEHGADGLVPSEALDGLADGPYRELGGEPELLPNGSVRETVNAGLGEHSGGEALGGSEGHRRVESPHRIKQ